MQNGPRSMRVDAKVRTERPKVRTERPKVRVNGPLGLYKTARGKCKFTQGACKTARIPCVNQLNPATCGNHSAASLAASLFPMEQRNPSAVPLESRLKWRRINRNAEAGRSQKDPRSCFDLRSPISNLTNHPTDSQSPPASPAPSPSSPAPPPSPPRLCNFTGVLSDTCVASGLQSIEIFGHAMPEQAMSFHYVYILRSRVEPDRYYVGLTRHLESRLSQHNRGETQSTKAYAPWQIEIATAFRDKAKATAFEQYLKTHSGRAFSKRHF